MSNEDRLASIFDVLRSEVREADKRDFLHELEGQLLDDDDLRDAILHKRLPSQPGQDDQPMRR